MAQPPPYSYPPNQNPPMQPGPPPVTHVTVTQPPTTQVIMVGNCPVCHAGNMMEQYTAVGIILAVVFFPIGILCCIMMTERVCPHCGARTG